MTSYEVVAMLRRCASGSCDGCPLWSDDPEDATCADGLMATAADLIEFQQQGLEALTKMDEGLKERGNSLREFLRRGDEVVQEHRDPAGPPGEPGIVGDEGFGRDDPGETGPMAAVCCEGDIFICPTCSSPRVFYNAEKDAYICPSCGWQDKEG